MGNEDRPGQLLDGRPPRGGLPIGPPVLLERVGTPGAKLDLAEEGAMEPEVAGSQGRGLPGLVTSTADRGDTKSHHCDFRTERISEA